MDTRDIFGGAVLILIGAFAAIYSVTLLSLGTLRQMGPGMFPAALGCTLAGIGALILIPALFRAGVEMPRIDIRSLVVILTSIFAFAIMMRPFGLVPAIVVLIAVVSRADGRLSPMGVATLAAAMAVGCILIFETGLGLPITAVAWPW